MYQYRTLYTSNDFNIDTMWKSVKIRNLPFLSVFLYVDFCSADQMLKAAESQKMDVGGFPRAMIPLKILRSLGGLAIIRIVVDPS